MKRALICVVITAALCVLASAPASCEETADETVERARNEIEELLPNSAREYLSRGEGDDAIDGVLKGVISNAKELVLTPAKVLSSLIPVIALSALFGAFVNKRTEMSSGSVELFTSLAVSAALLGSVSVFISETKQLISSAVAFCSGFVPVFAGVSVAAGGVKSATLFAAAMAGVSELFSLLAKRLIAPLNGVLLGISAVCAIDENGLSRVAPAIKKLIAWCLGTVTALAALTVNLRGTAAAGADSLALKTGRYLVGSAVPLVGSSVAEALGAVTTSLGLAKSGVGIIGIAALIAMFIPTIICGLLTALSIELCAALADVAGASSAALTLRSFKSCVEINVALLASFFAIISISVGAMISSV